MSFSIGDRVRVTNPFGYLRVGMIGIIRGHYDDSVFIDFADDVSDRRFTLGHDGDGHGPGGGPILPRGANTGYWINTVYVELYEREPTGAPKPFYLVEIVGGEIVEIANEEFDDGAKAAARASELTKARGHKVQARRRKLNDNWHAVEAERLASGSVIRLDVERLGLPVIAEHYAFIDGDSRVSYVPSEEYGAVGRRTTVAIGSYLQRFYDALTKVEVEVFAAKLRYHGKLKTTSDPKEAVRIYREGPDSCMTGSFTGLPFHPVSTYFGGDLALAYLEDNGAIIARCLIWPDRKLYSRAYGDIAKIKTILREEGYTQGDFEGARMNRVPYTLDGRNYFVLPFVDRADSYAGSPGSLCVVDQGDHFTITTDFEGYFCNQTCGVVSERSKIASGRSDPHQNSDCQRCEDEYGLGELETVVVSISGATELWCSECQGEHTYLCGGTGAWVCDEIPHGVTSSGGMISAHHVADVGGFICAKTRKAIFDEAPVVMANGATWSNEAFLREGFVCAGNGRKYRLSDSERISGKLYSRDYLKRFPRPKDDAPPAANDLAREPVRLRA